MRLAAPSDGGLMKRPAGSLEILPGRLTVPLQQLYVRETEKAISKTTMIVRCLEDLRSLTKEDASFIKSSGVKLDISDTDQDLCLPSRLLRLTVQIQRIIEAPPRGFISAE
jgi:hypothetical protein